MALKKYRAAAGRRPEAPGERPYTQTLMLALHQSVIEENRRQKAKKYSLRHENGEKGETFSLAFWSDYEHKEHVLVPAGTACTEANLSRAVSAFLKSMEETDFGRWTGADRERSMEKLRQLIAELERRAKEEAAEDG